jgi:ligand-binding sensor domain-containing protein/serine phosphatase RsbU (regulator of sigma subunit)
MALDPDKPVTRYKVHVWNTENGLPSNSIHSILQTRDGYLWIGTGDGLVRFDGVDFRFFNRVSTPQLISDKIYALYEDAGGVLWIGTKSGGLASYKDGEFFTYPVSNNPGLDDIRAINRDRWGYMWIGSLSSGLTSFKDGRFVTSTTKEGLPHNKVKAMYRDANEDLWVVTVSGIIKLLKPGNLLKTGNFEFYAPQSNLYCVTCLYREKEAELWIGTWGKGLFRLEIEKGTSYRIRKALPSLNIVSLHEDRMKNLWIGTEGGGLVRMKNDKFSTLSTGNVMADDSVSTIYEDREGSLWVGTLDGGLHQLKDSIFTTYTTEDGLLHNTISCVYQNQAGDILVGTEGGLNRLHKGAASKALTVREGLLHNTVSSLYEDASGDLLIGTWAGLQRLKNGKLTLLIPKEGLSGSRIWCLGEDSQANLWIGTENGLNRQDRITGAVTRFFTKDGLHHNHIEFIFKDSKQRLWIGTGAGLNFIRAESALVENWGNATAETKNKAFHCACEDKEGVLWFGTGSGLVRLKDRETILYTSQNGLIENDVYAVLEDGWGYLWLAGHNGVSRIAKKELKDFTAGKIQKLQPQVYNEKDGMNVRWCARPGFKSRDNRMWFPTSKGIAVVDPDKIEKNALSIQPIIEKLVVDGVTVNIHTAAKKKQTLELEPGKKRLEFYYTGVSFTDPRRVGFKLKLEGYDSDWVDMGKLRSTTYTGLYPGHYTFKVTTKNTAGNWNKNEASFSFYLKPYFYQTTWFYVIAALAIVLFIFAGYRFRVRQLKAREKELSALVEMRTRDLQESNIELRNAHQKIRKSKEIIEEKNRNITDSIRYARRIQQSMLPMKEKMAKHLEDSFVLYLPKDIVSGDFYWFDVIEDRYFLALADCTGHGVPGALLSIMGYMMLNEVLQERRILDPAKILARLHQGFRYVLKQETEDTDTLDGMDIGLCRIDLHARKITFAGARRPLFYVKNSELIEIKGDRKSIGGRQSKEKHVFTNHEIDFSGNSRDKIIFYLTTDGFADQHDLQDQRYGSHRLKTFLRDIAHMDAAQQQQALLEEFIKHRADEEQRDDISIIGIRIIPDQILS